MLIKHNLTPLPLFAGVGFTTAEALTCVANYNYQKVNNFHNYHVTENAWKWPITYPEANAVIIDGFSPNLNKALHCGHLKNLIVASALTNILAGKAVAMLGASKGINPGTLEAYKTWCERARYYPHIYLDNELPPADKKMLQLGEGTKEGCLVFNNVVIYKSNGDPTYAAHDLAFAKLVAPDIYLTGGEQKEHFNSLGLGSKHQALGLLQDINGKKMNSTEKSKTLITGEKITIPANSVTAEELFKNMVDCLNPGTKFPEELAWNILAWQFNSSAVGSPTKFNPKEWAKPEAPGVYITYTYARVRKAILKAMEAGCITIEELTAYDNPPDTPLTEIEYKLLGQSEYLNYYTMKAQNRIAPCCIAAFALDLAKTLSSVYQVQTISNGSKNFIWSMNYANKKLKVCMQLLGMHAITEV